MTIKTAYHASTGRHWWIVRAGRACVSTDGVMFPAIAAACYHAARLGIKKRPGWRVKKKKAGTGSNP